MAMKNYIFDLYGTLVDIHTNEAKPSLWRNMAMIFSMLSAEYEPAELKKRYHALVKAEVQKQLAAVREKFRDEKITEKEIEICLENVFYDLLAEKKIQPDTEQIRQLMLVFRSLSLSYVRLYDKVPALLQSLKESRKKVYLLSNAQRPFTEPEMKMLGLYDSFDGILYSSDAGVKKPSPYFYDALFKTYGLKKEESLMIGNDYEADVMGADAYGLKSVYVHTAQSGKKPSVLPESCRQIRKISELLDKPENRY